MSDEPPGDFMGGFAIPLPDGPGGLGEALTAFLGRGHDRMHMQAEALAAQVDRFLTGLDVDGLLALRTILNSGDMSKSLTAQFFDGQLVSILRYVKHVDPASGKDPLANDE